MEKVTYSIHCDKYQVRKNGKCAIYMRITINRKTRYLPLSKYVEAENFDFNQKRFKIVNAVPSAKELNRFLSAQEVLVGDIILDLQRRSRAVTFESIKRSYLGGGSENYRQFCLDMLEEDSVDMKETTVELDTYKLNKIEVYHPNLSINEIDERWLKMYKRYLVEELNNKPNTHALDFRTIRKNILKAIRLGIIKHNPFDNFTIRTVKSDKEHLTIEEQHKVVEFYKSKKLLKLTRKDKRGKTHHIGRKYQEILQHFLIGCFCGLRVSDIATLTKHHCDRKNRVIIKRMVKGRKGEEKVVRIPITDQLREVLDLNRNDDKVYRGFVRVKSCNNMNTWLREILQEHIGICHDKHITFHCSRHTFAVTCLTLGMPLETLQDIMGHSDIKTTQIYAKVIEDKRQGDMHFYWSRFNKMKPDQVRLKAV